MNIHKNARLTVIRRLELVRDIVHNGFTPCAAAAVHGVTGPSARKWLGRYLAEGETGLRDRSSKPKRSPRRIKPEKALAIRHVDAGSCNGCKLEIHGLNNPYYNIEGLGIKFVASPREILQGILTAVSGLRSLWASP